MVEKHNKVIRDNIPEIIKNSGRDCKVKTLDDENFLTEIENKLYEEIDEYFEDRDISELADILEIVYRIAELRGYSAKDLENMRKDKNAQNGSFSKNLYLIEVTD